LDPPEARKLLICVFTLALTPYGIYLSELMKKKFDSRYISFKYQRTTMVSHVLLVVLLSCWPVGLKWMGQEEITVFFLLQSPLWIFCRVKQKS